MLNMIQHCIGGGGDLHLGIRCIFEASVPTLLKMIVLSYSSGFVSVRQSFVLSTDHASFEAKNIRAGSPDLFMSMSNA